MTRYQNEEGKRWIDRRVTYLNNLPKSAEYLYENGNIKQYHRDNSVDTLKLFFDSGKLSRLAVIENCSHSIIDGEGLAKIWGDEAFYHDGIILEDICFDKNGKEVDCAILFKQKEN